MPRVAALEKLKANGFEINEPDDREVLVHSKDNSISASLLFEKGTLKNAERVWLSADSSEARAVARTFLALFGNLSDMGLQRATIHMTRRTFPQGGFSNEIEFRFPEGRYVSILHFASNDGTVETASISEGIH
jgi:hypothetical protein